MRTFRSDGQNEARAYVEAEAPPARVEPTTDVERVEICDPRRTPTLRLDDEPKSSGPRNPEQLVLPAHEEEPRIELPEGLPLTAAQPVFVPPELAAKWREEARRRGST